MTNQKRKLAPLWAVVKNNTKITIVMQMKE